MAFRELKTRFTARMSTQLQIDSGIVPLSEFWFSTKEVRVVGRSGIGPVKPVYGEGLKYELMLRSKYLRLVRFTKEAGIVPLRWLCESVLKAHGRCMRRNTRIWRAHAQVIHFDQAAQRRGQRARDLIESRLPAWGYV